MVGVIFKHVTSARGCHCVLLVAVYPLFLVRCPVLSSVVAHLLNVVTKLPPLVGSCCKVVNGSCYHTVNLPFIKPERKVFQSIKSVT